jgi:hypothetical protein
MAVHDNERRTASDYMHGARTRYDDASTGSRWAGILVGLALIAFIVYLVFSAAYGPSNTGDAVRQTPQNPTTTTAPRSTPTGPTTQPQ